MLMQMVMEWLTALINVLRTPTRSSLAHVDVAGWTSILMVMGCLTAWTCAHNLRISPSLAHVVVI